MPEMNLGDAVCGMGADAAEQGASVPACIHPELLFDEVAAGPYVGLVHRLSGLALSEARAGTAVGRMLQSLARALDSNLVCIVRQSDRSEMSVTSHSTRNMHTLGNDVISLDEDPLLAPFLKRGCPVVCERVKDACGEKSFFRRAISISAFALLPVMDPACERCGLLITWQHGAPDLRPEQLVALGSISNIVGAALKRARIAADLDHEKESRRRYTRLVAGREVRMAELKSENAKLKDLVITLSRRIGELEGK
jgi:hypothetical protein